MCVSRARATGNDLQLNQWLTALVRRNVWRLAHVLQVRNLDWFNKSTTMKFTAITTNELGQTETYQTQRTTVDVNPPENKRWTLKDVQGKRKPSKVSRSRSLNRSTDLWAAIEKENGSIEWSTCGIHRSIRYV